MWRYTYDIYRLHIYSYMFTSSPLSRYRSSTWINLFLHQTKHAGKIRKSPNLPSHHLLKGRYLGSAVGPSWSSLALWMNHVFFLPANLEASPNLSQFAKRIDIYHLMRSNPTFWIPSHETEFSVMVYLSFTLSDSTNSPSVFDSIPSLPAKQGHSKFSFPSLVTQGSSCYWC